MRYAPSNPGRQEWDRRQKQANWDEQIDLDQSDMGFAKSMTKQIATPAKNEMCHE